MLLACPVASRLRSELHNRPTHWPDFQVSAPVLLLHSLAVTCPQRSLRTLECRFWCCRWVKRAAGLSARQRQTTADSATTTSRQTRANQARRLSYGHAVHPYLHLSTLNFAWTQCMPCCMELFRGLRWASYALAAPSVAGSR